MPLGTPYINAQMLMDAPTGVSWSIIPKPRAQNAETLAEVTSILWRATSIVDTYVNQVLRATVANEQLTGPGAPRFGFMPGTDQFMLTMRQWPISEILAIQYASNRPPLSWNTVASTAYLINHPLISQYTDTASATAPDGGWSIQLDQCAIGASSGVLGGRSVRGRWGRNGLRLLVSYTNGWPHTSLTATATAGATTLAVDDVTGWAGASGFVYDGASTEPTSVTAVSATTPLPLPNGVGTAQTGPGTVTLSSPIAYTHPAGTVVSALPANVLWATVLAAAAQALEAGMDSIAIQTMPGVATSSGGGVHDLEAMYEALLDPFRRIA